MALTLTNGKSGAEIPCPTCSGEGWKDGVSPLVEV